MRARHKRGALFCSLCLRGLVRAFSRSMGDTALLLLLRIVAEIIGLQTEKSPFHRIRDASAVRQL